MTEALAYVRQHAEIPPTLESIQDQNAVGPCPVPATVVAALHAQVTAALTSTAPEHNIPPPPRLCFLDGFLLYSQSMTALAPFLDIKLLLRASHARASARRAARAGYVTLHGFWEDPPGYMDQVVWPNYVREHARLFVAGDVEGPLDHDVLRRHDIRVPQGDHLDPDMSHTLRSMVDIILEYLSEKEKIGEKSVD